jgi:hypothetical protein
VSLAIVPCTLREARAYVAEHHRHHAPPQGGLFALACSDGERIRGVAIVGRPVARELAADFTAELTRCCTDGARNACSMLYGAAPPGELLELWATAGSSPTRSPPRGA